jgi:hypothetical protein
MVFPSVTPAAVLHRPRPAGPILCGGDTVRTLAPPVFEVSTWQPRPGEVSREHWTLNRWEHRPAAAGGTTLDSSAPAVAALRRPRAVAGADEAVALTVLARHNFFRDDRGRARFHFARLLLTQTLGVTDVPADDAAKPYRSVTGVLTTEKRFFPPTADVRHAAAKPAQMYYAAAGDAAPRTLERMAVNVIATAGFEPESTQVVTITHSSGETKQITVPKARTFLTYLIDDARSLADLPSPRAFPTDAPKPDEMFDDPDGVIECPDPTVGPLNARHMPRFGAPPPAAADYGWTPLPDSALYLREFVFDLGADEFAAVRDNVQLARPLRLQVGVVTYLLAAEPVQDPSQWTWRLQADDRPFELAVQFLDKNSAFRPPKPTVSLLASPNLDPTTADGPANPAELLLAGYGQLGDTDFSPIGLRYRSQVCPTQIEWVRNSVLRILLRMLNSIPQPEAGNSRPFVPYHFDLVFTGPGGELVPVDN